MAQDRNKIRGEIIEALPNYEFRVKLADESVVRCYVAGKVRFKRIQIVVGDKVDIVYPRGSSVGRITWRV